MKPKPPGAAETAEAVGGAIGGCVGLIIIGSIVYSCASSLSPTDGSNPSTSPVEMPRTPLQTAQKNVGNLSARLRDARDTCQFGPPSRDIDGSDALDEVDVAMADSIGNVSPAQEQRIRESIGAEMGLAPSQVDGWRDIYRARADQARRRLERRSVTDQALKRSACANVPQLEREVTQAEQSLQAMSGAPGPTKAVP